MQACFPQLPVKPDEAAFFSSPVKAWLERFDVNSSPNEHDVLGITQLSFAHQMALSRLIPLLVCGEQSSQWVFYNEAQRMQTDAAAKSYPDSLSCFEHIVADEQFHEQALNYMHAHLPLIADLHRVKRKSQHFFISLGACDSLEQHFAQITCLDSLVCKIMLAIEKSALPKQHSFVLLCRAIKQDEAKHVSFSKLHAQQLGFPASSWKPLKKEISQKLFQLLNSEQKAFEALGVDLKTIFEHE